jgi:signal peptidase
VDRAAEDGRRPLALGAARSFGPATLPRLLSYLLLAPLVGGAVVLAIALLAGLAGYRGLVVTGSSMEPTIPLGSMVVVKTVDPHQLRVGDIVTYSLPGQTGALSTHRVVRVEASGDQPVIHTKGDAKGVEDGVALDLTRPVGLAWYWVPLAGYLAAFLNQPGGKVALAIMVGLAWWLGRQGRPSAAMRLAAADGR